MQLGAALKRVGAEITREVMAEGAGTLYLRVDPAVGEKWVSALEAFILQLSGKPFEADVSKEFFGDRGVLKFRWRVTLRGDVTAGLTFLGACALEGAMAHTKEITSFPLVGRVSYPFDPARGKLKGGHEMDTAAAALGVAIGNSGAAL